MASERVESSANCILTIPDVYGHSTDPGETLAAAVLKEEEHGEMCSTCDGEMMGTGDRCSRCLTVCHEGCMSSGAGSGDVCIGCAAADDQRYQHEVGAIGELMSSVTMSIDAAEATDSKKSSTALEVDTQCSQKHTPIDAQSQPVITPGFTGVCDGSVVVSPERLQTDADLMVEIDGVEPAQMRGRSTADDKKAKPNHKVVKKSTNDTTAVKQRELRQQDLKLRRWEEELKLREGKISDMENCVKRLEEYLGRTEARNVELEKTVRTLQRKIDLLECTSTKPSCSEALGAGVDLDKKEMYCDMGSRQQSRKCEDDMKTVDPFAKANEKLILGIHHKITRYVLNKVEQQLGALDHIDSGLTPRVNPSQPVQQYPQTSRMAYQPVAVREVTRPESAMVVDQSMQTGQVPVVSHNPYTSHTVPAPERETRYTSIMSYPDMCRQTQEVSTTLAAQSGYGIHALERTCTPVAELLPSRQGPQVASDTVQASHPLEGLPIFQVAMPTGGGMVKTGGLSSGANNDMLSWQVTGTTQGYQYSGMQGQPEPAAQCGSSLDAVEKIPRYGVAGYGQYRTFEQKEPDCTVPGGSPTEVSRSTHVKSGIDNGNRESSEIYNSAQYQSYKGERPLAYVQSGLQGKNIAEPRQPFLGKMRPRRGRT